MKILLPVDGSAPSLHAVHHGLQLVQQGLRASFVLVNVQEPPSLYEVVVTHDAEQLQQLRQSAGAELLAAAEAALEAAGVDYESEVAGGSPAALVLELLENYGCEMVVMGARGMGEPQAGGMGSVAQAVLQHSAVPVTLVRAPSDDAPDEGPAAE